MWLYFRDLRQKKNRNRKGSFENGKKCPKPSEQALTSILAISNFQVFIQFLNLPIQAEDLASYHINFSTSVCQIALKHLANGWVWMCFSKCWTVTWGGDSSSRTRGPPLPQADWRMSVYLVSRRSPPQPYLTQVQLLLSWQWYFFDIIFFQP